MTAAAIRRRRRNPRTFLLEETGNPRRHDLDAVARFNTALGRIGNLGSDPEMRYTPSNRAVTQFNVAVNQSTKNQQTGEWVEETDWFRVSVWGDRAERAAENLRKGNRLLHEVEMIADEMVLIGRGNGYAWTTTTGASDLTDTYVERLNPDNPREYLFRGRWEPMECRTESYAVKGAAELEAQEICRTRHGFVCANAGVDAANAQFGRIDRGAQRGRQPGDRRTVQHGAHQSCTEPSRRR